MRKSENIYRRFIVYRNSMNIKNYKFIEQIRESQKYINQNNQLSSDNTFVRL